MKKPKVLCVSAVELPCPRGALQRRRSAQRKSLGKNKKLGISNTRGAKGTRREFRLFLLCLLCLLCSFPFSNVVRLLPGSQLGDRFKAILFEVLIELGSGQDNRTW